MKPTLHEVNLSVLKTLLPKLQGSWDERAIETEADEREALQRVLVVLLDAMNCSYSTNGSDSKDFQLEKGFKSLGINPWKIGEIESYITAIDPDYKFEHPDADID